MKTGIELIAIEREEHISKHCINTGIDILHNSHYQLAYAAEKMCVPQLDVPNYIPPVNWDEQIWSKMISKNYKERLIIAGSLIAAELDRLQSTSPTGGEGFKTCT